MGPSLGVPDKNAIRVLGGVILPGAIVQFACMAWIDEAAGTALLRGWLVTANATTTVVGLATAMLLGFLWSAACNYAEEHILDGITKYRLAKHRASNKGVEMSQAYLDRMAVEYDEMWLYYRARISNYENRHLSGMATSFYWEWCTGSAILAMAPLCMIASPSIARAFCGMTCNHVLIGGTLGIVVGAILLFLCAPWTHLALAEMRERMIKLDHSSPFFRIPIENRDPLV